MHEPSPSSNPANSLKDKNFAPRSPDSTPLELNSSTYSKPNSTTENEFTGFSCASMSTHDSKIGVSEGSDLSEKRLENIPSESPTVITYS